MGVHVVFAAILLVAVPIRAELLVQQTGSDQWTVREAASRSLELMKGDAYRALLRGAATSDDPEVRRRCAELVSKHQYRLMTQNLPSIYRLPPPFNDLARHYHRDARGSTYAPRNPIPIKMRPFVPWWKAFNDTNNWEYQPLLDDDDAAVEATRKLISDLYGHDGWSPTEIIRMLDDMRKRDEMDGREEWNGMPNNWGASNDPPSRLHLRLWNAGFLWSWAFP